MSEGPIPAAGGLGRAAVEPFLDEETILRRVAELGEAITAAYRGLDLVLVGVLKGSAIFLCDLCRCVDLPLEMQFVGASSYGSRTETSGDVRLTVDLFESIEGRHVLVVDDIVDTGLTMRFVLDHLAARRPASIRVCVLIHKPARSRVEVPLDFVGFTIEDRFVVGYGLDAAQKHRNRRSIGVLRALDG